MSSLTISETKPYSKSWNPTSEDEWNRIYAKLQEYPTNLHYWEDLITCAEYLNGGINRHSSTRDIELFRFSYEQLLQRYPLLQAFWIRYASKLLSVQPDEVVDVYERAVSYIPRCVQLWSEYCGYCMLSQKRPEAREMFERASALIGSHYFAHEFWDKYLEFEEQECSDESVFQLLYRIIQKPLHQYARYFDRFRMLTRKIPVHLLAPPEMLEQFHAEYEMEKLEENTSPSDDSSSAENDDLRLRVAHYHLSIYLETQSKVHRLFSFESKLLKHYYSPKGIPLDVYNKWLKYLDFLESGEGTQEDVILLYERALIPAADADELWLRYYRWLVANDDDCLDSAIKRGIRVVASPILPIYGSLYFESKNDISLAGTLLQENLQKYPSHIETISHLAYFSCRNKGYEAGYKVFEEKIVSTDLLANEKALLAVELAGYLVKHNKTDEARLYLESNSKKFAFSFIFWKFYLKFELKNGDTKIARRVLHEALSNLTNPLEKQKLLGLFQSFELLSGDPEAAASYFALNKESAKIFS